MASKLDKIRRSKEYRHWHDDAIEKANGKCNICGTDKKPQVHHINSMSYFPEQATDPNNAIVLCRTCHFTMFHILFKGGTRKKATKKDLRKFKAIAKYYMKKGKE